MTVGDVYRAVGTRNIPEPVRMLSALPGIDYADQLTLSPHAHATPLSAIHRRLVPGVLRHAAARLAISSARADRTTP